MHQVNNEIGVATGRVPDNLARFLDTGAVRIDAMKNTKEPAEPMKPWVKRKIIVVSGAVMFTVFFACVFAAGMTGPLWVENLGWKPTNEPIAGMVIPGAILLVVFMFLTVVGIAVPAEEWVSELEELELKKNRHR